LKLLRTLALQEETSGSATLASIRTFVAFVLVRSITCVAGVAGLVAAGLLRAGLSDQR
jgi:hypothetical protein